jgi:hypothetical protein
MAPSFNPLLERSVKLRKDSLTLRDAVKETLSDSRNAVARAKATIKSILVERKIKRK